MRSFITVSFNRFFKSEVLVCESFFLIFLHHATMVFNLGVLCLIFFMCLCNGGPKRALYNFSFKFISFIDSFAIMLCHIYMKKPLRLM